MKSHFTTLTALIGMLAAGSAAPAQTPLSGGFTYQGKLDLLGSPLNGTADFEFTLWDAEVGPAMIGAVVPVSNVTVVDGLFTVEIDFGVIAFNGDNRWLEIAVRSPAGGGAFTTLDPRQPLTAAPYALQTRGIFVNNAGNVGIGTTTPGAMLDVAGEIRVQSKITSSMGGLTLSGGGSGVRIDLDEDGGSSDSFSVWDTGVERFRIDGDTGNVGIGTASPNEQLEITGNFRIPASTTTAGVIYSGGDRFIHNTGTANLFAGVNAGNLSTSGSGENTGIGQEALQSITIGQGNTAIGRNALRGNTLGSANTAIGWGALRNISSGNLNIAIGREAGLLTTGENNILIGNRGVAGEWNTIRLGDSTHTKTLLSGDVTINSDLTVNTDTLFVDGSADRVGIGTSAPNFSLHVEETGDGAGRVLSLNRQAISNTNLQEVSFNLDPTNAVFNLDVGGPGNSGTRIHLGDQSTGSNDVTMLGNLGIGTTTPATKLDVVGTVTATAFVGDGSELTNLSVSLPLFTRPTLLDQDYSPGDPIGFTLLDTAWQSFTAGMSADLAAVEVNRRADGGAAVVNLYEGEGTGGTLLATTSIPAQLIGGWQTADFSTTVPIVGGSQYTIELSSAAGLRWKFDGGYAGGRSGFGASADFLFRTHIVDPSAELEIALSVGLDGGLRFGPAQEFHPVAYDRQTVIVAGKITQVGDIDRSATSSNARTRSLAS